MTNTAAARMPEHAARRATPPSIPNALPAQDPVQQMIAEIDRDRGRMRLVIAATLALLVLAIAAAFAG